MHIDNDLLNITMNNKAFTKCDPLRDVKISLLHCSNFQCTSSENWQCVDWGYLNSWQLLYLCLFIYLPLLIISMLDIFAADLSLKIYWYVGKVSLIYCLIIYVFVLIQHYVMYVLNYVTIGTYFKTLLLPCSGKTLLYRYMGKLCSQIR